MAENEHEWLTVAEVAAILRITPATVRRWITAGKLPAFRVGPRGGLRVARKSITITLTAGGD